jgi:hypothetical protein
LSWRRVTAAGLHIRAMAVWKPARTNIGNCLLQSETKVTRFLVFQIGNNLVMRGVNALKNPGYANNIFWSRLFYFVEHLSIRDAVEARLREETPLRTSLGLWLMAL